MCYYTRYYYVYSTCVEWSAHFFRISTEGSAESCCAEGPHERYIVVEGKCMLC